MFRVIIFRNILIYILVIMDSLEDIPSLIWNSIHAPESVIYKYDHCTGYHTYNRYTAELYIGGSKVNKRFLKMICLDNVRITWASGGNGGKG